MVQYFNELNIHKQDLYCLKFYIFSSFFWVNVTLWNEQFNLPYVKYRDAAQLCTVAHFDLLDSVIDSFIHAYYNYHLTVIIQLKSISHIRRERKQCIVYMFACLGLEIITQYLRYQIFVVYQRLFRREICRDYMVMPAFEQGKLSVCTAGKENLSIQVIMRTSSSRKTCRAVHTSKQNLSRKSCGEKKLACQVKLKSCVPGLKFPINKQLKYQILQSIHLSFF